MRHVNIPVFIPHLGCPNNCVFCNQRKISGVEEFDPSTVRETIEKSLTTVSDGDDCEIAYFGGSFTGIGEELMIYLLDTAEEYVRAGRVSRIRCSTRPDYISKETTRILSRYTIGTVELGIQSMNGEVLEKSKRGHTPDDSRRAVKLLLDSGIKVGGQMMTGLPGSTKEDEIECAREIVKMGCLEARIYPTIVFAGTELESMMKTDEYAPLTLDDAVDRSAGALRVFIDRGVRVLRIGLCDNENLHSSDYSAGPNHPSIGELVISRVYRDIIESRLGALAGNGGDVVIAVNPSAVSAAVGNKKENIRYFKEKYGFETIKVREDRSMASYDASVSVNIT